MDRKKRLEFLRELLQVGAWIEANSEENNWTIQKYDALIRAMAKEYLPELDKLMREAAAGEPADSEGNG
jgi:hypothetical protein